MQQVEQAWAGFDAGKQHHHLVVIDSEGGRLLSRQIVNGEAELCAAIDTVRFSHQGWLVGRKDWVVAWGFGVS
jgi:Transposase